MQLARKHYYLFQTVIIACGAVFAWYTVIVDFVRFFNFEGTIFKIQDCIVPNPFVTPCFWGAVAFLVALAWAWRIRAIADQVTQRKNQKLLVWFLAGGSVFGWSNMTLLFVRFFESKGQPTIGCSGLLMTNPFTTPCFYGSVFFLASFIVAYVVYRRYTPPASG